MNKTIFIIAIVIAILIGAGYFLINSNPELKAKAIKFGIIDAPATIPAPANYNAVFFIFDPSGSGKTTYSVPYISVEFIQQLIASITDNGWGELWLTFVDRSASNNKVLHLEIPEKSKSAELPVRQSGELKGEFDRRLAKFKDGLLKTASQNDEFLKDYAKAKSTFLQDCREMINKGYAPKSRWEDYSDVIGSLNAACRSFSTIVNDSTHFRSIMLVSDGVQDIPDEDVHQMLNEIPEDILLITVNHSGSQNNVVAGRSLEIDNLDRGIEKIIRVFKPLKQ